MGLHPAARQYLDAVALQPPKPLTVENLNEDRELFVAGTAPPIHERPVISKVEDRVIPGPDGELPIRIYSPEGNGTFPVLVFFHGGGWVRGSVETTDVVCRRIAQMGHKVVSVEYRLAPENPFPAGAEDCYAATRWVADHIEEISGDPHRISVGGESAGGNLATVVSMMARDRGGPTLSRQVLIYPITDCWQEGQTYYNSIRENASGYGLTKERMCIYWKFYVPEGMDQFHPYVAPMREQNLSGLPQALVLTAEYDVLRDEGEVYGAHLQSAGVSVIIKRFEGMIHGFLSLYESPAANDAYHLIDEVLR